MANYNYSFQNPMKAYKSYTKELTNLEINTFRSKYERVLSFKQANFWIASKTGIDGSNIKDNEQSLYISDALGRSYSFPYSVQVPILKRIDGDDSLGILSQIKKGNKVSPFNWRSFTTNNLLVGYCLNMIDGLSSSEWDTKTLNHYFSLCDKIKEGKIKAVFIPFYLAPPMYKPFIRHCLLATQNIFGVGAAFLFDYSDGYQENPCAIIPDIDFITQFDLTAFKALGLGQMYQDYNTLMQTKLTFSKTHLRCDSPKPKDLVLSSKNIINKNEKVYTTNIEEDTSNKLEDKIKLETAKVEQLSLLLNKIKDNLMINQSNPIIDNAEVIPLVGNSVELSLSLHTFSPDIDTFCPITISNVIHNASKMFGYKTKQKQSLYLNIIYNISENQTTYVTNLGIYGTSSVGMAIDSGKFSILDLKEFNGNIEDFLMHFMDKESYDNIVMTSYTFEEQVFRGLYEAYNIIKLSTKFNLDEYNSNNITVKESENEYKIEFMDSVYKQLVIKDTSDTELEYLLIINVGKFDYEPEELTCVYKGDGTITDVVKNLVIETFNSLL